MLNRHYEWVLLGHNLASLTLGQHLLTQKKSVLILDDGRFMYPGAFENYLSFIPKEAYKCWLEGYGLSASCTFDSFLAPTTYHVCFGTHLIQLGHRPWQNIRELFRKVPFLFMSEQDHGARVVLQELLGRGEAFDQEILDLGAKIALMFSGTRARKFPSFQQVIEESPFYVKKLFLLFLGRFQDAISKASQGDAEAWEKLVFYFLANAFHHKKLALPESESELFFLLVGLLMPAFSLDNHSLKSELSKNFVAQGGAIRASKVQQVMQQNSDRVWGLELDTYDGIVHPKNLVMAGGPVSEHPFHGEVADICQFVQIQASLPHFEAASAAAMAVPRQRQAFYYGNTTCMGQDSPLAILELAHHPSDPMSLSIPVRKSLGMKESFIEKDLREVIQSLVKWPVDSAPFIASIRKGDFHLTDAYWPIGPMQKVFQQIPTTPNIKGPIRGPIAWEKMSGMLQMGISQLIEREGVPRPPHSVSDPGGNIHGLSLLEVGELGQLSLLVHLAQLLS